MAQKRIKDAANEAKDAEKHPVHPRNLRFHGLLGIPYFRQHFVYDKNWQHLALTQQFGGMTDVLIKRRDLYILENKALRRRLLLKDKNLKNLGRDGRTKLQMTLVGDNSTKISNILINHRDLQRLYQNMPLHTVVEKMDQQAFVFRKERDRLVCRIKRLESGLENRMMEAAAIETRIKYYDNFVLEEHMRANEFQKKISNSRVRLQAIKYLNSAYKKMLQVLQDDAIFYEPIIRSLQGDSEDQAKFINHILAIGLPAISRFRELGEEYKALDEQGRKFLADRVLVNLKRSSRNSTTPKEQVPEREANEGSEGLKRYVRETESMLVLKNEMKQIENVIKQIKFSTLCSKSKEIFPRIKIQKENNKQLVLQTEINALTHDALTSKHSRAGVLFNNLVHNEDENELKRKHCITFLENSIKKEEDIEAQRMRYLNHCAKLNVMFRYSLWNIHELLRHVDHMPKKPRLQYPNPYLKLPLLKFEMLTMQAVPPEVFDENVIALADLARRKVDILVHSLKTELTANDVKGYLDAYYLAFIQSLEEEADEDKPVKKVVVEAESEEKLDMKQRVPTRKQLKQISFKIVEEFAKKENE